MHTLGFLHSNSLVHSLARHMPISFLENKVRKVSRKGCCRFDTMGVQGQDFKKELLFGAKPSKGLRQAKLSPRTKALLEEVALSEQVCSPFWVISFMDH